MQLKQFYNIATKVSSRKSATTFGDLPDCSKSDTTYVHHLQNEEWLKLLTVPSRC